MDEKVYWLGFSLLPGVGAVRVARLLDVFGNLQAAWQADERALMRAGISAQLARQIQQKRQRINLQAEHNKVTRYQLQLLTWQDDAFPVNLRHIPDPPIVLYMRGNLLPDDNRALAVVGTRSSTRYGRDAAHYLARELARHGVTIISGLADGIDAAAHRGALDGGGRTLAICGNGLDTVYPSSNKRLAREMETQGALLSEFSIGAPPHKSNFPRRNRIISGMALGVLVIEAPMGSGALITAEAALEQGRDVFAVPANIFNPQGTGTNKLIQDGAKLVQNADDILNELQISYTTQETRQRTERIAPSDDPVEQKVLGYLDNDPIAMDDIIRQSGLSAAEVMSTLTVLELKGLAQKCGPMQYCRTR